MYTHVSECTPAYEWGRHRCVRVTERNDYRVFVGVSAASLTSSRLLSTNSSVRLATQHRKAEYELFIVLRHVALLVQLLRAVSFYRRHSCGVRAAAACETVDQGWRDITCTLHIDGVPRDILQVMSATRLCRLISHEHRPPGTAC